jgi:hypothetical protein
MSINFNHWFIALKATGAREYVESIDWVYHAKDAALSTSEVLSRVSALRGQHVDTVTGCP